MARNRYKPEEIVGVLRQAEVLHGRSISIADAVRQLGIGKVTYCRWRKECGGMSGDQLRRLNELEKETARWRRAVSDLTLDNQILTEAARGSLFSIRSLRVTAPLRTSSAGATSARLVLLSEVNLGLPHDGVRGAGGSI